jgi:hypothetical protein
MQPLRMAEQVGSLKVTISEKNMIPQKYTSNNGKSVSEASILLTHYSLDDLLAL